MSQKNQKIVIGMLLVLLVSLIESDALEKTLLEKKTLHFSAKFHNN